jgi:phage shock protein PspC (stress-responsive transcriptional regulator)
VHPAPTVAAPRRLPLRRPERGRLLGGVALGLAAHLDLPVGLVRLAFVVLTPVGGVGALLYVFWWLAIPAGDPADAADAIVRVVARSLVDAVDAKVGHKLLI